MNWFDLVLGEGAILTLTAAMIAGVFSGHSKAQNLFGVNTAKSNHEIIRDSYGKSGIVLLFIVVIYFDSDDLLDTFVRVAAPVGLYKVVQTFITSFFVWRMGEKLEHAPKTEASNNG